MHLYVGKKIVERYPQIIDHPQFYLGCIISDSVNIDGLAEKAVRWAAHIRSNNINEWYDNNIDYYHSNLGNTNRDLLLGYVVHNITDAAFDEFFSKTVQDGLSKMGKKPLSTFSLRWDDCFRFDYDQSKECWWRREVLPNLKKAYPIEINGIKSEYVSILISNIIKQEHFDFPEGNPLIITTVLMDVLSNIVCKIIDMFIFDGWESLKSQTHRE